MDQAWWPAEPQFEAAVSSLAELRPLQRRRLLAGYRRTAADVQRDVAAPTGIGQGGAPPQLTERPGATGAPAIDLDQLEPQLPLDESEAEVEAAMVEQMVEEAAESVPVPSFGSSPVMTTAVDDRATAVDHRSSLGAEQKDPPIPSNRDGILLSTGPGPHVCVSNAGVTSELVATSPIIKILPAGTAVEIVAVQLTNGRPRGRIAATLLLPDGGWASFAANSGKLLLAPVTVSAARTPAAAAPAQFEAPKRDHAIGSGPVAVGHSPRLGAGDAEVPEQGHGGRGRGGGWQPLVQPVQPVETRSPVGNTVPEGVATVESKDSGPDDCSADPFGTCPDRRSNLFTIRRPVLKPISTHLLCVETNFCLRLRFSTAFHTPDCPVLIEDWLRSHSNTGRLTPPPPGLCRHPRSKHRRC